MPHAEVGAALRRVRATDAYRSTLLALEFLVLTAARSGEVCELALAHVNSDRTEAAGLYGTAAKVEIKALAIVA